jgi:hypothetical protein
MIKTFIQYNSGNPNICFRALKNDNNSCNVLRLLMKAIDKGAPKSIALDVDPKHLTFTLATNLKRQTDEKI